MANGYPLLKSLTEQLMKEVRTYGILEVSTEQYQNVCNSIVRFAEEAADGNSYSPELMDAYAEHIKSRCISGDICKEYLRFQNRVIRMLSSLANTGEVDFSNAKYPLRNILYLKRPMSLSRRYLTVFKSAKTQKTNQYHDSFPATPAFPMPPTALLSIRLIPHL